MSRNHLIEVALATIAFILLAAAILLYSKQARYADELAESQAIVAELREKLDAAQAESAQGGAETDVPEPAPQTSQWTWPIAESDYIMVTSLHGRRISPILRYERWHQGIDIMGVEGAQIVAAADGVVVPADEWVEFSDGPDIQGGHWPAPDGHFRGHPVYGGLVIIRHEDGWHSLYAHLDQTWVHGGQRVTAGQLIGRQGSTGASRGAHLHMEIITPDGGRVNPLLYLTPETDRE